MNDTTTRFVDFANPAANSGMLATQSVININIPQKADADLNPKTYLTDPSTPPNSFSLNTLVAAGSGVKQLYFADACGLAEQAGLVGGALSQEFNYTGVYTPASIKRVLQSYALIVLAFNFDASNQQQLKNNLQYFYPKVDEDLDKKQLFTAPTVSNQQFNADLLNVGQAFVWTNQTALKLNITPPPAVDETFSFTFSFLDVVPYGKLAEYLKTTMLPIQTRTLVNQPR